MIPNSEFIRKIRYYLGHSILCIGLYIPLYKTTGKQYIKREWLKDIDYIFNSTSFDKYVPILRTFDSVIDDENVLAEIMLTEYGVVKDIDKYEYLKNILIERIQMEISVGCDDLKVKTLDKMCSYGIDCFDLIDNGQALDVRQICGHIRNNEFTIPYYNCEDEDGN